MITINLLPQEYRRRERASLKVFGSLLGSIIVVCCSLIYLAQVYFGDFKAVEGERLAREDKLQNLDQLAKYDDALVKEKTEYEKRATTIQMIANSRVLWTEKLDDFIDITNNQGNTERHNVWFRGMTVKDGGAQGGPSMSLTAYSQSRSYAKLANFLDDVKGNEAFFQDMATINAPGGRVVNDEEKVPPDSITFKLELRMKPPNLWARGDTKIRSKERDAGPGAAPKKGGGD